MPNTHPEIPSLTQSHPGQIHRELHELVEKAAHYLPAQGLITSFVHHNTLHAFESLSFDEGVRAGGRLYGCQPYLPEQRYREHLRSGRIRVSDLEAVLLHDLQEDADRLVALFGTRYVLRLTMLRYPIHFETLHELRWTAAESDGLRKFRGDVSVTAQERIVRSTQAWMRRNETDAGGVTHISSPLVQKVLAQFDWKSNPAWSKTTWDAFALSLLWQICREGVLAAVPLLSQSQPETEPLRHRDAIFSACGEDADQLVNSVLIPFCAAMLDQGFANSELPARESGFYQAFLTLYGSASGIPGSWENAICRETQRLQANEIGHLQAIEESLQLLGVAPGEWETYITQTLLALRGWAGMIWQLETEIKWARRPLPAGSLLEFLAVRLLLDRLAVEQIGRQSLDYQGPLRQMVEELGRRENALERDRFTCRAFTIFQLAQLREWGPTNLLSLTKEQWASLIQEMEAFGELDRRRLFHRAYERKYANEALDAILAHSSRVADTPKVTEPTAPIFQVVTCIDDREESLRRHLEEIEPACETFGTAGFFGVAMFFRGIEEARFAPLAPAGITPQHYVTERPVFSAKEIERTHARRRRNLGKVTHQAHLGSRSFFGGIVTGLLGSVLVLLLLPRVFLPRLTSKLSRRLRQLIQSPDTEMRLERDDAKGDAKHDSGDDLEGYDVTEMADIVEKLLRAIGLPRQWSPLVILLGHGSTTQNNPHESAYNCGACSGAKGGPNARAFAIMANDVRVREILAERGLAIPESTCFVGGYHDTTSDAVSFADLDRVPGSTRDLLDRAIVAISAACARNAHERCRRFESVPLDATCEQALAAVEDRPEDLSQVRPEYNHATNAICLVGSRAWSRGLFLDRRAFLSSYAAELDDQQGSILEAILRAVIPVSAGINLEYYFSTVDPKGYGCGSKLPHNITSLVGVMSGAESDLRPGLSSQMVEIHEPMRILFVIETTRPVIQRILENNPGIARLVCGEWVQLAVFDPATGQIHRFTPDGFVRYQPESSAIATRRTSQDWYAGQRGHLGFATIDSSLPLAD